MNKLFKSLIFVFFYFFWVDLYASSACPDAIAHKVTTKTINDEPVSTMSVTYNEMIKTFTIPFIGMQGKCEEVGNNGILKITVPSDRPKMDALYYFNIKKGFYYIGSALVSTSIGEEQVFGIGEIKKGDASVAINLTDIAGEDSAIIHKIMGEPYSNTEEDNIPELYKKMRYIEIDGLSEYTSNKICENDERVFFYCQTKSGKKLNLCYNPFSGEIIYTYGKHEREITLNSYSFTDEKFIFQNNNTKYKVSPDKGEISVIQNGKQLSVITCT